MNNDTPLFPGLSPIENREITARFDGGALSSNGGVLVLRELEHQLRFADMIAGCMSDKRDPNSITHSLANMIQTRMFAICCGHEDCNDMDRLRDDPALKMACDRLTESGTALASQPTLSRLENAPTIRELVRMAVGMIDLFCMSFKKIPAQIMLDIDDTPDRVHGGQQLSLFNSHSGGYCFKPIHIYDAATGKPVFILLRPGKRPSGEEAACVMRFVVRHIRRNWPRVSITIRGDGHYGGSQTMDFLEQNDCFYIFGQPGNARLTKIARPWCEDVATRRVSGQPKDKIRRFFPDAIWRKELVEKTQGHRSRRSNRAWH
ncbi:MAG: IS1380 family transposase [Hyphomicrobiaceae bacterium]|nr:IS1380 family transposase [Hyphomicrobiaceae bacterium]